MRAHAARRRLMRLGLGDMWTDLENGFTNLIQNAASGNLTQEQVGALQEQETQTLTWAGMPPAQASQQAASDVNGVLSTVTLPGAFGVTWTGALPTSTNWLDQAAANAGSNFSQNWLWYVLLGLGIVVVAKEL